MNSYKELIVWQKGIELCKRIYEITERFPKNEMYGLTSHMRRCAVSIPSNIAEGYRRGHRQEYIQFLRIAFGSASELETQLIIANSTGLLSETSYKSLNSLLEEILKMLNVMLTKLHPTR